MKLLSLIVTSFAQSLMQSFLFAYECGCVVDGWEREREFVVVFPYVVAETREIVNENSICNI